MSTYLILVRADVDDDDNPTEQELKLRAQDAITDLINVSNIIKVEKEVKATR